VQLVSVAAAIGGESPPAGERELLGTMPSMLLDVSELGELIDAHYKEAGDRLFRMEQLPRHNVPHQTAELERWLAGEVEPNWETKQP
jgi:hypothetical protein